MVREVRLLDGMLVVEFSEPLEIVSTIPPGHVVSSKVVFRTVDEDFDHGLYGGVVAETRRLVGDESALVFLTAVDVNGYVHEFIDDPETHIFATMGFYPPICVGLENVDMRPSTINILVVTRAELSFSGLVDLLKTVVEAKTGAVADALLWCESRSLGTVTDAVAVGRPVRLRGGVDFAGMGTRFGRRVAERVYRVVVERVVGRGRDERLRDILGVDREWIVERTLRVYGRAMVPGVRVEDVEVLIRRELDRVLDDPNVWAFLVAARELDLHGYSGTIPGVSGEEFRRDPHWLIADDTLGLALALYLAGVKGLFAMYWVERLKKEEKVFEEMGVFVDDIVSAIIASVLSRVYDELVRRNA